MEHALEVKGRPCSHVASFLHRLISPSHQSHHKPTLKTCPSLNVKQLKHGSRVRCPLSRQPSQTLTGFARSPAGALRVHQGPFIAFAKAFSKLRPAPTSSVAGHRRVAAQLPQDMDDQQSLTLIYSTVGGVFLSMGGLIALSIGGGDGGMTTVLGLGAFNPRSHTLAS